MVLTTVGEMGVISIIGIMSMRMLIGL